MATICLSTSLDRPLGVTLAPIVCPAPGAGLGAMSEDSDPEVEAADECLDPPALVIEGLYIGSAEAEHCRHALSSLGITHVLQVGGELTANHDAHFTYKRLVVSDEEKEDLIGTFREAFPFIDAGRAAGGVLVHCAQGMSRSGTVVIGYVMWKEDHTLDSALGLVQRCRPVVEPNRGFMLQLKEFERAGRCLNSWQGWNAELLSSSFRRHSVSGRKVVHHFSEVIRKFHVHSLTDDDLVFQEDDTVLSL